MRPEGAGVDVRQALPPAFRRRFQARPRLSHSAEHFPVAAYVGSSKNRKELKNSTDGPASGPSSQDGPASGPEELLNATSLHSWAPFKSLIPRTT